MTISTENDPIWCTECGRLLPWKHAYAPTWRARVANPIRSALQYAIDRVLYRAIDRLNQFVRSRS